MKKKKRKFIIFGKRDSSVNYSFLADSFRNYIIIGPKLVRCADTISVWVTILNRDWSKISVAVSLFNEQDEVASNEDVLIPRIPTGISFRVPENAPNGSYSIYVRGTLPNGDVVFYNETKVMLKLRYLSIFIQLDKPIYRHEQTGFLIEI